MAIWPFQRGLKPEQRDLAMKYLSWRPMPEEQKAEARKYVSRLSQDDWAQAYDNYFTFGGMTYPIIAQPYDGGDREPPPNDFDQYARNAYKACGVVFAVCHARALPFSEVRFCFLQRSKGRATDLYGSKNLAVLERPWPNGTTGELLYRAMQDTDLAGNFYCVKEYDKKAGGYRLRRLHPGWVDIVLSADPREAVKSDVVGYIYKPNNTTDPKKWITYPIDGSKGQIAHWSPIPDPESQYRGMSWLTPIVREIMADKGATKHKEKFFEQGATPQLAIKLPDVDMTPDQFKDFVRQAETASSGVGNAYKTLYLTSGADVTVIGAHMQQLDLRNMQSHMETRIAAAGRIHHMLLGLAEPIHGSPLDIGGYQAAKDMFGDTFLRPMWRTFCAAMEVLVDLPNTGSQLWYDDREVSFLRADRQAQSTLMNTDAQTFNTLAMAGWTPESIKAAMVADGDWTLLKHSGLTSVQMYKPGEGPPSSADPSSSGDTSGSSGGSDDNTNDT